MCMKRGKKVSGRSVFIRPRDVRVLRGLFESRLMKLSHIAALYFDGSPEAAKKRIQKL